jgi:hypothetical protein
MKAGNPNKEIPLFQKVLSDTSDFFSKKNEKIV